MRAAMLCPHCNAAVAGGSKFCGDCGKALTEAISTSVGRGAMMFHVNLWGGLFSILTGIASARAWLAAILTPSQVQGDMLSGMDRFQAVIVIGVIAGALYGVLWKVAELAFGWKFGEAERSLPKGFAATVLSTSLAAPLVLLPPLYARIAHRQVVSAGHWTAALAVIVVSALGHIFLYGSDALRFPGVRNVIFPVGAPAKWLPAIEMETVYALTHFCSVVLVYRVVLASTLGPSNYSVIFPTFVSAVLWLSGVGVFLFLTYPQSLENEGWVGVRGIIHGFMLAIALEGGMLM